MGTGPSLQHGGSGGCGNAAQPWSPKLCRPLALTPSGETVKRRSPATTVRLTGGVQLAPVPAWLMRPTSAIP